VQHGVASLVLGGVGQEGAPVDVADGIDVWRCLQEVISGDPAGIGQGNARVFEPEAGSVRLSSDGDQGLVGPDFRAVLKLLPEPIRLH